MVKAYYRYEHALQFGVVASPNCNVACDNEEQRIYTAALENVNVWNSRTGERVACFEQLPQDRSSSASEVVCIRHSAHSSVLAAGHADGCIRLWNTAESTCIAVFHSHSRAVTAMAFSAQGSYLASGSQDTDIILWDVAGEVGMYKLHGHTNQVTALAILDEQNKVISAGKDGFIRVWDMAAQFCMQTIPLQSGSAWAMAVDPAQRCVAVGSVTNELQMYSIRDGSVAEHAAAADSAVQNASGTFDASEDTLKAVVSHMGVLEHDTVQRMTHACFSDDGSFLAACSTGVPGTQTLYQKLLLQFCCDAIGGAGPVADDWFEVQKDERALDHAGNKIQLWRKRSAKEAGKKAKQRLKRAQAKLKQQEKANDVDAEEKSAAPGTLRASDVWDSFAVYRADGPVRGFDFLPNVKPKKAVCRLTVVLANNSIEFIHVLKDGSFDRSLEIAQPGNRSAARGISVSEDDALAIACGNSGSKVWDVDTGECVNDIDSGYGLSVLFAPGSRFAALGCKNGKIELLSIGAATVVQQIDAHTSQVWCLDSLPDRSGFVSCSADKHVKVWKWDTAEESSAELSITEDVSINTGQDVLCVKVSPDSKLIACSLVSNVIKVFYLDSMKWFVDLYGHRLPALTMDISSDSTLLVSGSADKNIKFWGLDFGDCHKSLFAHSDSVMSVAFVNKTHYVFTSGKDGAVKYWDADTHELLLELPAHHAAVWCLKVSHAGDFVLSGSHDRSIRRWDKSEDVFFLEEEKEKRLERILDTNNVVRDSDALGVQAEGTSAVPVPSKSQEVQVGADKIVDALDLMETEEERKLEPGYHPNVLLLGLTGSQYVLRCVSSLRANDLETACVSLSFADALALLKLVPAWIEDPLNAEVCVRLTVCLLKAHHSKLMSTPACKGVLADVQQGLRTQVQALKSLMGFNVAGLNHIKHTMKQDMEPSDIRAS